MVTALSSLRVTLVALRGFLWLKLQGLSTQSCSGCHSTAPYSGSSQRSVVRKRMRSVPGAQEGPCPPNTGPNAHHDDGNHDSCNANEVQLPREELINLLVAVILQGRPVGGQRLASAPRHREDSCHPPLHPSAAPGALPGAYLPFKNKHETHGCAAWVLWGACLSPLLASLHPRVTGVTDTKDDFPRPGVRVLRTSPLA
jgi:hypothetical protein